MIDAANVRYRWVGGREASAADWDAIEAVLAARGWMSLNRQTCRIRVAEQDGVIVGFSVFQWLPYCGPLYVAPSHRGTGLAEQLSDDTIGFLEECNARGWIAVADSPFAKKLCEAHGMTRLESPVYTMGEPGGI